jgi:autotransporter-associated beta strand protein
VVAVDGGGTLAVSADNEAGAAVNTIALTSSNASNLSSFQANASFASGRTVTLYQVGGAIDVTSGNTLTLNGPIAGAGGLYKTDAGTLVLANASAGNAYVGPTTVVAGTLALTATNTLPITTPVTVDSGATLNVSANTQVGSFAGSGAITIASGKALTVGFNTGGSTFGGTITGAGSLVFAGPGSLGLTGGGNTFSGGLTISNAGTFAVGASAGTGQITLSGASTLQLTNPTFTFGPGTGQTPATSLSLNVSTGGGILSAASGSNITLPALYGSGTLTVTGGTTITSAGYLNSSGGVIAGTSTGTIKLGTSSGDAADTLVLTQVAVLTGEPGTGTAGINLTSEGSTFWQNNITDGYDSNYVPVTNTTTHVTSANFAPYIGGTGSGTLTMNDGTIWKVTGKSTYGAGSPTIVDGATVTINVPASTDQLICGTAVRQTAPAVGGDPGTTSNQINVTGNGLVQFGSGAVTTQAFNGTWNLFGPGQTGTLLLENVPGGGGETLDALGYTLTNGTGEGVQSPVILNGGTIAFGADQPNPAGAVVLPVNSFRSPMSLYGGSIASSGYEYNLSATVTYGGAVFDTTPVKANIDGDITLESNSTVTVLTYDPQNPTAGSRSVNFETSGNGVTPNYGVAGNFTWDNNSTLVISPGSTTGGAVNFGRVGGTVAVRGSATLQINAGSTANIGFVPGVTGVLGTNGAVNGPVSGIDPLTDSNNPGQSVSVIDNGAIVWGGRTSLPGDAGQGIKTYGTGALTIGPGATATLNQADTHTDRTLLVVAGALTVSGTGSTLGTININNNDMIIRNGNLSAVTSLVATGYSNGNWTGNGITSAVAAANSTHLTAIGVIQNDNGTGTGTPLYPTFDGYTSSDGDVLVKYTYYGDTNLDGVVDGSDYSNIDYAYAYNKTAAPGAQLTGWANGDFNYDGVIDGSDYALIDNTFNNQGASLTSSAQVASATAQVAGVAPTAVPEPAGLSLIAAGIATIGLRRRRSVG